MSKFLKIPLKQPEYRMNRNHKEFLTSLSSRFDSCNQQLQNLSPETTIIPFSAQTFQQRIITKVGEFFPNIIELSYEDVLQQKEEFEKQQEIQGKKKIQLDLQWLEYEDQQNSTVQ